LTFELTTSFTTMLETSRLRLVPLSHELLLLYKNDQQALAQKLGYQFQERHQDPATAGDVAEALEYWLKSTAENPDQFEWFTNWEIILKSENVAIGGVGFAGFPDQEGKTITGYGLDVRYFGKGYASEALEGLLKWAFGHTELKKVIADTFLDHVASQRVLIKNGFVESSRDEEFIHWEKRASPQPLSQGEGL